MYIRTYVHILAGIYSASINIHIYRCLGSVMKDDIPRNSCLAQWSRRIKIRLLYPHAKLSLSLDKPFTIVVV